MTSEMYEAVRQLVQEKGISEELVMKTIESFLFAAYKKMYGTTENVSVEFAEEGEGVALLATKVIVDEVCDPVLEISLDEACEYDTEAEIGDELALEIDPRDFDRIAIQSAKQKARQTLREIQKDSLYSEFKGREGELIIGYYQRERNGNIFVDLGKTEGVLPKRFQSPREAYRPNDRIRAMIQEVSKNDSGLSITLTRSHIDFIKRIFELEVPEIYDKIVEVHRIAREPGYRTKLAVYSNRDNVDSVGACVGIKGIRIQSIVRELEGEKIDVLRYDPDPRIFIKNALSPAEVEQVFILDEVKRQALAVVQEKQLALAIGKQGLNVRLANRLVDWNIDVKTVDQLDDMDLAVESKRAVSALFSDDEEAASEKEITRINELPGMTEEIERILVENNVERIDQLIELDNDQLLSFEGLGDSEVAKIREIIARNVNVIEEDSLPEDGAPSHIEHTGSGVLSEGGSDEEEEDVYECPECGSDITIDMVKCPNCGVGLSFETEEEE